MSQNMICVVFDDRGEAERAVSELRNAGIQDRAISLIGRPDDSAANGDDYEGHDKGDVAAGVIGGGVAGAILGVAALAIPGVGPLAAAGAIAASAVPAAAGFGAAAGATVGALAKMLTDHDVERTDAEYFEQHLNKGATFVSVETHEMEGQAETAREILYRNGGHSASRPKVLAE